jgi:hypothetical protein
MESNFFERVNKEYMSKSFYNIHAFSYFTMHVSMMDLFESC